MTLLSSINLQDLELAPIKFGARTFSSIITKKYRPDLRLTQRSYHNRLVVNVNHNTNFTAMFPMVWWWLDDDGSPIASFGGQVKKKAKDFKTLPLLQRNDPARRSKFSTVFCL